MRNLTDKILGVSHERAGIACTGAWCRLSGGGCSGLATGSKQMRQNPHETLKAICEAVSIPVAIGDQQQKIYLS